MWENSWHGLIFYVLSQNLPGETEDNHENPDSGQPVSHQKILTRHLNANLKHCCLSQLAQSVCILKVP